MVEREVWGMISEQEYKENIEKFTALFGAPHNSRRLALRFGSNERMHINTRIRITDGNATITQKIHDRKGLTAIENELEIENNSDYIVGIYDTYRNLIKDFENIHFYLVRFENCLFRTQDFEIKLTHQIGNKDIYSFEVEALNDNADITEFCDKHNLVPDPRAKDNDFWVKYNKKCNIDISSWSDKELLNLLNEYIK